MVRIILKDRYKSETILDPDEVEDIAEIQESYDSVGVDTDEIRVEGVADFDEESFDDYLDELVGDFVAENNPKMRFSASRVLKVLDPTTYRMIQSEEEDFQLEQARDELREKAEDEEQMNWVDNIFRNFF